MGKFVSKDLMNQHITAVQNEIDVLTELDAIISKLSEDNLPSKEIEEKIDELNTKLENLRKITREIERQIFEGM
jgi:hypothetical protein